MKHIHFVLLAAATLATIALLALPWVSSDGVSISMLEIIKTKAHGSQVGYVVLVPVALGILVGALSIKRSQRWMTGVLAFLLIPPTLLSAVARHGALGAHLCTAGAGLALIAAIILTIKPNRAVA